MLRRSVLSIACVALVSCTSSAVGQLPTTTTVPLSKSVLELAVGTATISLGSTSSEVGLNVVETFRNGSGSSATTTNTPTLSGPAGAFGVPGVTAISGLTLTQQTVLATQLSQGTLGAGSPLGTTTSGIFGNSIGAFGYGFAPDDLADPSNSTALSTSIGGCALYTANGSARYNVEPIPMSAGASSLCPTTYSPGFSPSAAPMTFTGGPPLWPSPAGYGLPIGFAGYGSGFSVFVPCADAQCVTAAPPLAGTYALSVAASNGGANSNVYSTATASAMLPAAQVGSPLPAVLPATMQIQADGTALVNVNVPVDPRIYETIVYVTSQDCGGGFLPPLGSLPIHNYALITKSPGAQTLLLSNLGPPGADGSPTHTFCTLSDEAQLLGISTTAPMYAATATAVSYDYPAFEAAFPANRQVKPTIATSSGTADLSISSVTSCLYAPAPAGTTVRCPAQ